MKHWLLTCSLICFGSSSYALSFDPLPADTQESTNKNFKDIDAEMRRLQVLIDSATAISTTVAAVGVTNYGPQVYTTTATTSASAVVVSTTLYNAWQIVASTKTTNYSPVTTFTGLASSTTYRLHCVLTSSAAVTSYNVYWDYDQTTAYEYAATTIKENAAVSDFGVSGATLVKINPSRGSGINDTMFFAMEFRQSTRFDTGNILMYHWQAAYRDSAGGLSTTTGGGSKANVTAPITSVQISNAESVALFGYCYLLQLVSPVAL